MAIYHLSVKTISRSAGRSATAAAAYRSAEKIEDKRTGEVHDYSRKGGVESAELVLPPGAPEWAQDRALLWNAAEEEEKRKNSTVAREIEVALPAELDAAGRRELALVFAQELVKQHGCAVDVAIHRPGREGDNRNHHAHLLLTTRKLEPEGFTQKTRELDEKQTGPQWVTHWRQRFAELQNQKLKEQGHEARVDHRTLLAQGIDREPGRHLGPAATGYERRRGQPSRRRQDREPQERERPREPEQASPPVIPPLDVAKEQAALRQEVERRRVLAQELAAQKEQVRQAAQRAREQRELSRPPSKPERKVELARPPKGPAGERLRPKSPRDPERER